MIGVVIAMVADGRIAVAAAALVSALCLAPDVAYVAGQDAALTVLGFGFATPLLMFVSYRIAQRLPLRDGIDPVAPMFSSAYSLFGPRSTRVAVAVLALPCASWMTFNVAVPGVAVGAGVLFPPTYTWLCGAGRLLVAKTVEDLGVGVLLAGFGIAVAWSTRDGASATTYANALLALGPVSGLITGWLIGRHRPVEAT